MIYLAFKSVFFSFSLRRTFSGLSSSFYAIILGPELQAAFKMRASKLIIQGSNDSFFSYLHSKLLPKNPTDTSAVQPFPYISRSMLRRLKF